MSDYDYEKVKFVFWGDSPEGIRYEVSNHRIRKDDYRPDGTWCYYLIIFEDQVSPEVWDEIWLEDKPNETHYKSLGRYIHDYYASSLSSLDWHGGITYYEKNVDYNTGKRSIKVGCDYAHLWDEGNFYDENCVRYDALKTCAEFAERYKTKVKCGWNGDYFDPKADVSENVVGGWKGFLSPAGFAQRSAYLRKEAVDI